MIRVLIADDQRLVREGLATIVSRLPGVEVVATAIDGAEALELARVHGANVVLMDLRMPGVDGVAGTAAIRGQLPGTQVVILTTYADDESVLAALAAGAIGYLTKDAGGDDLRRAIEAAASGHALLDPAAHASLVAAARSAAARPEHAPDGLTERETEVLSLMAQGRTNSEIARRLVVTEATVKTHVNHIFAKTGSRDRAQAVIYAHQHGFGDAT